MKGQVICSDPISYLEAHIHSITSCVPHTLNHGRSAPITLSKVLPWNPLSWLELYVGQDKWMGMRIHIYVMVYVFKKCILFYANTQKHKGEGGPRSKFICLNIKIQPSEGKLAAAPSCNTKNNNPQKNLLLTIPPSHTCTHLYLLSHESSSCLNNS